MNLAFSGNSIKRTQRGTVVMKNYLRFETMRKAALTAISWSGVSALLLMTWPVNAQVLCPDGLPCINDIFISTTNALVVNVDGASWDVINVRWSRPGREGEQTEHRGRTGQIKVLTAVTRGVVYTVSVQGCNKRAFQSSRCTDWNRASIKAGARSASNF